jgi:phosphatidylserine synthase
MRPTGNGAQERAFRVGRRGQLIALRGVPGVVAIGCAYRELAWWAGTALVVAAAADLAVASVAARRAWRVTESDVQLEGFVDFTCFVWAPVAFALSVAADWPVLAAAAPFVAAGVYRLARFNIEGVVGAGYRGLPVTYSAVAVPAAGLLGSYVAPRSTDMVVAGTLVLLAILMPSSRFITRRVIM